MRNTELFKPGIMLMVSWQAFKDIEPNKWFRRPTWSALITTETTVEDNDKMKWKKIYIDLYDVNEATYIKVNYKFLLDAIEYGTVQIIE
jgi:hypothetical protein